MITNVEATPAATPDDNMIAVIDGCLERRGLLPGEHLVDKGCTDSHMVVPATAGAHSYRMFVVDEPTADAIRPGLRRGWGAVRGHEVAPACPDVDRQRSGPLRPGHRWQPVAAALPGGLVLSLV